jgi:uncharacterized membrane protein
MGDADTTSTPHDAWQHLTDEEHRILHAVLRRTPVALNAETPTAERLRFGQRMADMVTNLIGSWPFIVVQSGILLAWIVVNTVAWRQHWDPYPFILLNLALSFQAAYSAPIIMMSQNRQAAQDRLKADADYAVNTRAELDVAAVHARLDELAGLQWTTLVGMQQQQLELLSRIAALTEEVHQATIGQTHGSRARHADCAADADATTPPSSA